MRFSHGFPMSIGYIGSTNHHRHWSIFPGYKRLIVKGWPQKISYRQNRQALPQFFIKPQLTSSCALFLHKNVFFAEDTWVHQTERDWKELSVGLSDSLKGHAERLLMASHGNHG